MANDSQRDKARAIFGKTFFENSKALPNPKNAAAALQKRANDRPIPTYKVGGVVKKQKPPQPTAAEREADRKRREEYAKMKVTKEQGESITRGNRAAAIEGGRYKDGGKIGKYKQGAAVTKSSSGARSEPIQNLNYNLLSGSGSGGSGSRGATTRITPTGISQPSSALASMAGQGPPKGYGFKVTRKFKKGGEAMAGAKRAVKAEQDFTGLMKEAAARAAAKGTPVMKQGGATNEYTAKRVMSRIKAGNFKDGGRADILRDRRMKDIEKDYRIALAKGKNEGVAKAKYEQRMADAADDYAKRTKADRTKTKAGEKAAEAALTEARRTKGESIKKRDMAADINKYFAGKDMTPKAAAPAKAAEPAAAKPVVKKTVAKAPKRVAAPARAATPAAAPARTVTPAAASTPAPAANNRTAFANIATPALLARTPFGEATAARLKKQETERAAKAKREETAKAERLAAAKAGPTNTGGTLLRGRPMRDEPQKVVATTKPLTAEERKKRDAEYIAAIGKYAAGGVGKVRKGMMKGK
jgi:hypothetical protein